MICLESKFDPFDDLIFLADLYNPLTANRSGGVILRVCEITRVRTSELCVSGALVLGVCHTFQLEGRMFNLNLEMFCHALLKVIDHGGRVPIVKALVVVDMSGQDRQSGRDLRCMKVVDGADVGGLSVSLCSSCPLVIVDCIVSMC